MKIKAIIFDAGDIFYDAAVWRKWLTQQLQLAGVKITYDKLVERWEALLVDVYLGKADYWERFEQFLLSLEVKGDRLKELKDMAKQMGKDVQIGRKPFDGVPETLAELKKKGIKLAVLSDTESTSEKVCKGLKELGIAHFFDEVVTSFDIKAVKPQPQAYQAVLKKMNVDKSEAVFVGHDEDEIEGASRYGLKTIAFNNDRKVSASFYAEHFSDLLLIVE